MPNRYRYNGKELQDELGLNWYDYDFRWYDPAVGRFVSVDPLAEDFAQLTTYQYASNSPIAGIDLDGLELFVVTVNPTAAAAAVFRPTGSIGALGRIGNASIPRIAGPLPSPILHPTGIEASPSSTTAQPSGVEGTPDATPSMEQVLEPIVPEAPEAIQTDNTRIGNSEGVLPAEGDIPKEGIYEFPDAKNPGKNYVGQSGNIPRRLKQHERSGKLDPNEEPKTEEVKGGKTQREIAEQNKIDDKGGIDGGKVSNKRNPIGKSRRHLLDNN